MGNSDVTEERTLIIVDDDRPFLTRLGRAMESRGFDVMTSETIAEGKRLIKSNPPAFAVVDMRLGDGNGLDVIQYLKDIRPDARAIILTGYGNIATACYYSDQQDTALVYYKKAIDLGEEMRKINPRDNLLYQI